jgi:glycosyltransferase involved in cell wall biosynthesis
MSDAWRAERRVVACMPAWNAAAFITPVLESLAAQTYPNLDVLISVDVSRDETAEICDRFAASRPRWRVIRQKTRLGWIANANALLRAADGDYLFFAFHDDPLQPQYVAKLADALERNPRAVLAFADIDTNRGPSSYQELDGVVDRFERARRLLLADGHWWDPNRGLFRASAARALGGLRRHLGGESWADWPWLLRLALLGEFVRVPEPLLRKNFRREGLSSTWKHGLWARVAVQLACLRAVTEAGLPPGQQLDLCWQRALLGLKQEWWRLEGRLRASSGS